MKIRYEFADGMINEIEVDDYLGEVLIELDNTKSKSDRKERRRHSSLNYLAELGIDFSDGNDATDKVAKNAEGEILLQAIAQLKPKQQEMIQVIFFEGISVNDYAAQENVDQSAISHRLKTVYKKLKKLL